MTPATVYFQAKIDAIEQLVQMFNIPYQVITYSGFAFAYFDFDFLHYVRSPRFVLFFDEQIADDAMIIEYWAEAEEYVVSKVEIAVKFDLFDQVHITQKAIDSPTNCLDLLNYTSIIARAKNPFDLIVFLLNQKYELGQLSS